MKPAGNDPFPHDIVIIRGRRRTVELALEGGALVARAPRRMARAELESVLAQLRRQLWNQLRRTSVFDDESLRQRAETVTQRWLYDQVLPSYTVSFSSRQRKRWGSCTVEADQGRVRLSDRLRGHPVWVVDHVLLHELIHLVVPHHGEAFQRLLSRDPRHDRASGYLDALEHLEQRGAAALQAPAPPARPPARAVAELPLFSNAPSTDPSVSPSPHRR